MARLHQAWMWGALLAIAGGCSGTGDGPVTDDPIVHGGGSGGEIGGGGSGGSGSGGGTGGGGSGGVGGQGGGEGGAGGSGEGGSGGTGGGTGGDPNIGEHLKFWGSGHGVTGQVRGITADDGGNIWIANKTGLLLLRRGSETWETFTEAHGLSPYVTIAVAGGADGEVFVGYEGIFDGNDFDDPPEIAKSGDVDRFRLTSSGLDLQQHYDISTPPSTQYPNGRDTLRTCYRIVPVKRGAYAGDVWFGCNHGVAMWNERFNEVQEHQHTFIDDGRGTMLAGDFRGLLVAPNGNVWMAGAHKGGLLHYGDEGGQFWARIAPEVDIWPAGVAKDPDGHDWTMVMVDDGNGGFWAGSFGNGVAHMASDGSWSYLDTGSGLPDNRVYDMVRDTDGSLWIATDGGIVRLQGGRITMKIDGTDKVYGVPLSLYVDTSVSPRRLLIGTSSGAAVYDGP